MLVVAMKKKYYKFAKFLCEPRQWSNKFDEVISFIQLQN